MLPDAVLHDLNLAATINGLLACCLLAAATVRRNDRLLRIGAGAALATALAGLGILVLSIPVFAERFVAP
jgi:hypothetical protein